MKLEIPFEIEALRTPLFLSYRGSDVFGIKTSHHDTDVFGVSYLDPKDFWELNRWEQVEIQRDDYDVLIYEIQKYVKLLSNSNPSILNTLFFPDEFVSYKHEIWERLMENRDLFITKKLFGTFRGFAYNQYQKLIGKLRQGERGRVRKEYEEKYGYDCYEEVTTEFLTDSGWKKFDEINPNTRLATLNISNGELEFQHYNSKTDQLYSGFMYQIDTHSSRAIVTPNHRLLLAHAHRQKSNNHSIIYNESTANWELISLENLMKSRDDCFHIRTIPNIKQKEYDISDEYIQLVGLYLSDGSAQFRENGQFKCVSFTQKKCGEYRKIIDNLMSVFPIKSYNYEKCAVWVLHGKIAKQILEDCGCNRDNGSNYKHVPLWCFNLSARQSMILWDAWMAGDGTRKKQNDIIYTSYKRLADDLQAIMIIAGIPCVVYGGYDTKGGPYGDTTMYQVMKSNITKGFHCIYKRNFLPHNAEIKYDSRGKKAGYNIKEKLVSDHRIVCFDVPNGTLITRNNGRPAIHGNSKNACYLVLMLRQGIEALKTGVINVDRRGIDAEQLIAIKNGEYTLDQIFVMKEDLENEIVLAHEKSTLPAEHDMGKIDKLIGDILFELYGQKRT